MDGVFINQKRTRLYNIIGLVCGLFSVLLFTFVLIVDGEGTLEAFLSSCMIVFFALIVSILCGASLYVNKRAFIHVDEERISAFCHYGLSLSCELTDVERVTYGGAGLNIVLKTGKKYNLMNLGNAHELGRFIIKRIPEKPVPVGSKEAWIARIPAIKKKKKVESIVAISGFAILILLILVGSSLTGNRELRQFVGADWRIFAIMSAVGVTLLAAACVALRKALHHAEELEYLRKKICQTIFQTTPLQPGNAIRVFAEYDKDQPIRLTVYAVSNSKRVYCIEERVNDRFELEHVDFRSGYLEMDDLLEEINYMTEISLL